MTTRGKGHKEGKETKVGGKNYLDLADEIDAQMAYLLQIVSILRIAFEGKTMPVPIVSVMDDIYERLEWLKETISELESLCKKEGGIRN